MSTTELESKIQANADKGLEAHLQDHLREDPRVEKRMTMLEDRVVQLEHDLERQRTRTKLTFIVTSAGGSLLWALLVLSLIALGVFG